MTQRWEQRVARAHGASAEATSSGVQLRTRPAAPAGEQHLPPRIPLSALATDRRESEPTAARVESDVTARRAHVSATEVAVAQAAPELAPAWLRNPQRALMFVALAGCGVLAALLYCGGFIG